MEPRVKALEVHVDYLRDAVKRIETAADSVRNDVSSMKSDMAGMKANIAHLPSKGFVVTAAVGTVAALTALLTLLAKLGIFVPGATHP